MKKKQLIYPSFNYKKANYFKKQSNFFKFNELHITLHLQKVQNYA